jgi:signal transduction histidine kinase
MDPDKKVDGPSTGVRIGPERRPGANVQAIDSDLMSELDVLQSISRAFGSSMDLGEATTAAERWVRAAAGAGTASVRLFLTDSAGGLYQVVPRMDTAEDPDRRMVRQEILKRRRAVRSPLSADHTLFTIPLISRGEAVGVLEVVAPTASAEARWGTLQAVASQLAILLRNLARRSQLAASLEGLKEVSTLAGEMARARTPQEAVRIAVRFCHQRFGGAAAGWLAGSDPNRFELVSGRGLGSARGAELRSQLRTVARRELGSDEGRRRVADRFADIADEPHAEPVAAGEALLVVAGRAPGASFRQMESLLADLLGHLAVAAAAERRTERLDLGIALTAHEVRGPLVGALAIIERILMEQEEHEEDHQLLRRCREQLEQLAGLVDGVLRWAVAGEPLDLRPTDLAGLVREAAASCVQEVDADRVVVTAPRGVAVRADSVHLRAAVTNVVRNALIYSPAGSKVSVHVRAPDGRARVTVRDRGPGIPAAEGELIFDPFMRGSAAHLVRSGTGLGLFIARRIMEAHGGRVWLGAERPGAVFHIELPAVKEG